MEFHLRATHSTDLFRRRQYGNLFKRYSSFNCKIQFKEIRSNIFLQIIKNDMKNMLFYFILFFCSTLKGYKTIFQLEAYFLLPNNKKSISCRRQREVKVFSILYAQCSFFCLTKFPQLSLYIKRPGLQHESIDLLQNISLIPFFMLLL